MKKIAIPVFLTALILGCALYVGAKTIGTGQPGPKPVINPKPIKPVTISNGSLSMTVSSSNTNVLKGSDGEVMLQIDLEAIDAEITDRKPLNLALVIDRSGSMADKGKLEYARQAAQNLVDRLGKDDRLSVVIYDDVAEVLVPSTLVTNPASIKNKIARITHRGSTNLSEGLILGHGQVRKYFDREGINQVIILSDGLANRGITSESELKRIVSGWGESSIRVTSMGLGADFNEDLMMGLANASGGHYHFIESPSQLASIYKKELNALMATVSKDVKVYIDLADGVKFKKVHGSQARVNGSTIEIPLGVFNSGQHRLLIAHLTAPTENIGKTSVAKVRLSYNDALQNSKKVLSTARLEVNCITNVAKVEKTRNGEVEGNGYWFFNNDENLGAINDLEDGDKDKAIGWYEKKIEEIRDKNKVYQNEQLEEQVKRYKKEVKGLRKVSAPSSESGKKFIKRSKEFNNLNSLGYVQ